MPLPIVVEREWDAGFYDDWTYDYTEIILPAPPIVQGMRVPLQPGMRIGHPSPVRPLTPNRRIR